MGCFQDTDKFPDLYWKNYQNRYVRYLQYIELGIILYLRHDLEKLLTGVAHNTLLTPDLRMDQFLINSSNH